MIKAIFFDVDGTLISHKQNSVPESTRTALGKLSDKGILRIVATGRHALELAELPVHDIKFDASVLLNGQLCLDSEGNILSENPISGKDKARIIEMFQGSSIPIVLVEKDRLYINFVNEYVRLAQQAISTPVPDVGFYTGNEIYQAVAYVKKDEDEFLFQQLPGCMITRWNDYGVDIVSSSGGKTAGIKEYLKISNIKQEETMAFGDGENDMDMLKFVRIGVAMGNADTQVKEIADYVTDSVDDDGIAKALKYFGIID